MFLLSELVGLARRELQRRAKNALAFRKSRDACDAEILVGGAAETAEVVVFARPYEVPVEEVAGAVEDGLDVSLLEMAPLDHGVDGFQHVGSVELDGTGNEQTLCRLSIHRGEIQ